MEVGQTTEGVAKGNEPEALCCEPTAGVKEGTREPVWSELGVLDNGDLNGLLSSDFHAGGSTSEVDDQNHGYKQGLGRFNLRKSKEEFSQQVPAEVSFAEMNAQVASVIRVVKLRDCLAKGTIDNSTEVLNGIQLPGITRNNGFHGTNFQCKEEVLCKVKGKESVEMDIATSNGECGVEGQEQVVVQARMNVEGASYDEQLEIFADSLERTASFEELHGEQPSSKERQIEIQGLDQEVLETVGAWTKNFVANQAEGTTPATVYGVRKDGLVGQNVIAGPRVTVANKVKETKQEYSLEESNLEDSEIHDEEIIYDQTLTLRDTPQPKMSSGFISEMLQNDSLSAEGLATKGFVFEDDESDGAEDSHESLHNHEDEESDEASLAADSGEEDDNWSKSKARKDKDGMEEAEDTGPLRTKHELDVLPPVPKVTAVLEPHHKPVSVGHISSVLDLTVMVESSVSERILNENSILWLTETRVPLGIVDEIFGPVKSPFYLIRFNEVSEIPEDAKTGVDVSYVTEFAEFVLRDNPSLYKKAVDASGLDDEELPSDEDFEYSDDEKEAAARMHEKSKRTLDNWDKRQGQDLKSMDGQYSKGQRTGRGSGRGSSGGRAAAMSNAVDSASEFVAGMDLRGSPWCLTWPGSRQQNGRRGNRGRQSFLRNSGHQEVQMRAPRTGPPNGLLGSPQHQESPQRRDRPCVAEQFTSVMQAQLGHQPGSVQRISFNAGMIPAHLQGQGIPRQQPSTVLQSYGYHQVPSYDVQFGIPILGNLYSAQRGQFIQNAGFFRNPILHSNAYFSNQGQVQMDRILPPGYGTIVHAEQLNTDVLPTPWCVGDAQLGNHCSVTNFVAPGSTLGTGAVAQDHRAQSIWQNNINQHPLGMGRTSHTGQRRHPFGLQQRSYPSNKGS